MMLSMRSTTPGKPWPAGSCGGLLPHTRISCRAMLRPRPTALKTCTSMPGHEIIIGRSKGMRHCAVAAASSTKGIESVEGLDPSLDTAVGKALQRCIQETDLDVRLPQITGKKVGKVRDTYAVDHPSGSDKIVVVTTDRQSAFDRLLASIPFKGQVLNLTSVWWMRQTAHIVPNALLDVPDPNIAIMQRCSVFPVEFVVRGFLTGSTETSLWTHYKAGARAYCGNFFPDGLKKNDRLAQNVITPTTKSEHHDVPISPQEIVAQGLMSQQDWDQVSAAALALFEFGQREAAKRGLLLVDTKYEFGKDASGQIRLIDEIHTPDSSRYWLADTYEERHSAGQEPQNIDKEFLRLWFRDSCDPYADKVLPQAPAELVTELSRRYILLYQMITGQAFQVPPLEQDPQQRMADNLSTALQRL